MKSKKMALRKRIPFQNLYYSLPCEIYLINRKGTIVNINRTGLLFCGLNAPDLLNHHYSNFPFLKEIISDRGHENLLTYSFEQHELRRRFQLKSERADKTVFYIDSEVGSVLMEGKFHVQVIIRDVTGKKNKEIELKKTVRKLNDSYNELMQFNFIVSHNLRAPVANILGLASVLNLPDKRKEEKQKIIGFIKAAVIKMDGFLKDLNVILAARTTFNSKKESVRLPDLIRNILEALGNQVSESGKGIEVKFGENANEIFTIKSFIDSIIYNLISNAAKYKSPSRELKILFSTEKIGNNIVLKISDNGIGIDLEKNRQHLFGLYKRFNLDVEGKGLGLHMTKIQVETLGGKISVESEIGKGTTFIVTLPA